MRLLTNRTSFVVGRFSLTFDPSPAGRGKQSSAGSFILCVVPRLPLLASGEDGAVCSLSQRERAGVREMCRDLFFRSPILRCAVLPRRAETPVASQPNPEQFLYTDSSVRNFAGQFYRVRSPQDYLVHLLPWIPQSQLPLYTHGRFCYAAFTYGTR